MAFYLVKVDVVIGESKSGQPKKKTYQYLVDAVSVTDAEAKVYTFYKASTVDFEVKSAAETKISEVI
jgi:hypothetical protein